MKLWLPVVTVNPLNAREHWSKRSRRAKSHRTDAGYLVLAALRLEPIKADRWRVHLCRVAPRMMDSHDGLRAALKNVVDGIADGLGYDDDSLIEWEYSQRTGPNRGVEIRIEAGDGRG